MFPRASLRKAVIVCVISMIVIASCENIASSANETDSGSLVDSYTIEAMKAMNITEESIITREQFQQLFKKVIFQDDEISEEEHKFYDKVVEKVGQKAPESFPASEIHKYLEISTMMEIIETMTAETKPDNENIMNIEESRTEEL